MIVHCGDPGPPGEADDAGFARFYATSVPRLILFLRSQGVPLVDAADCVQETMIKALGQWDELHHPHAWCRQVAIRTWARRVAGHREEPAEDPEVAGSPLIAPGADVMRFEQNHEVLRWLDFLPLRQRQVMAWTYDGAGPSEIADELGMDPQSVRSSLRKARANLVRRMALEKGDSA
jgi:RNA polymerase sigma factor (sigma-70 family)